MKRRERFITPFLPFERSKVLSVGLTCAMAFWLLAPKMAMAQDSVQRDPQAIAILAQTITAGGGQELLASIQDFTETGTVTYNWAKESVTGNVTVKSRGLHRFRIDADLPKGTRTTVVSGEGGSLKLVNGRTLPISRQSANDLGSLTLPYVPLIAAIKDTSTSIVNLGLVTHAGNPEYDIRLTKVYTKSQDPTGTRGEREERDFYIDPQTSLVVAIADRIHFGGQGDKGTPHEDLYSNYQTESGIMVPLTVVETVHGVNGLTMKLNQITFNSGLGDSDFSW